MRQRRSTGRNRRTIGAVVMAGVLIVAGAGGMRIASAGVTATAADIVVVDGAEFDVAGCDDLQINDGSVICDGEVLAPVDDLGAAEAAELGAAALEASCDVFAANLEVAQNEAEEASDATRSDDARDLEDDELVEDDAIADQEADVAEAQQVLLLACLALAEAKDGLDAAEQDAEDAADEDEHVRPSRSAATRIGRN